MKKFLIPLTVVVAITLVAVLCYVFLHAANVYDAIPDSAVAVMEIDDWSKFNQQLNSTGAARQLAETAAIKKLQAQMAFMQQLWTSNAQLTAALSKAKPAVSAHLTSFDDFDYLFTIPVNGIENDDILKAFNARPDVSSVVKRTFKQHAVVDVTMKDGERFSFTIIKGVLSFSFTSFLTENSIIAVTSGYNLKHDKDFNKVTKKFSASGGLRLFVNFKKAGVIFPVALKPQKLAMLGDMQATQSWAAYNVAIEDDRLSFSGVGLLANNSKSESVTKNILANTIWNNIPDNAAYVYADFNNLNPDPKKKADEKKTEKDDFKDWAGDAHAFVTLEPLLEDFAGYNLFLLQVTNEAKALENLKHLISLDGSKPLAVDTYNHVEIFNLKDGAIINRVFGGNFTALGNSFFGISNNVAVFCNSPDVLKFTMEKISRGETLNKDTRLHQTIGSMTTGTGMLYINPAKASQLFSGLIKEGSTLQAWLSKLSGISVINDENGEWNTTNAAFVIGAAGKAAEGLLWKTKLKALSDFAPQIVINAGTGDKEIFTQDTAYNIYLLSKSGEVLFTKNIGEKIVGGVYQLDYYNNEKLQYIFTTTNHIFMVDRRGDNAASYPLRLSYPATGGLTLVNTGNTRYSYYVPCSNGAIYGYEATGRPLSGWSPLKGAGVITLPLQSFKIKKSVSMLAFNNTGKLMLLGTKGEIKWSVANLPLANQNFSIIQTGDDFLVLNAAGKQLIEISSDGNDKLKPLIDSAVSFTATATSDSSYQYFFSSQHDVRSYNGKGEFKNAASLKSSIIDGIEILPFSDTKYLLVKCETEHKITLYDLSLNQIALYTVTNTNAFAIADLFDRNELIGIQPDANGNITCYRIR